MRLDGRHVFSGCAKSYRRLGMMMRGSHVVPAQGRFIGSIQSCTLVCRLCFVLTELIHGGWL